MMVKRLIFFFACLCPLSCYCQAQENRLTTTDTVVTSSEGVKVKVQFGILKVPENRDAAHSRLIDIHFALMKTTSAGITPPLIYLEGGGSPSSWQAKDPHYLTDWLPYLAQSDVLLIDQRGTHDRDLVYIWEGEFPTDVLVSEDKAARHYQKMATRALEVFRERGVDVTGYHLAENARDVEEVTAALGLEKFALFGYSYGTRISLMLLQALPRRISRAVLAATDGLDQSFNLPADADAHFAKLSAMVAADTALSRDIPDLAALLRQVMQNLKNEPVEVTVTHPLTGTSHQILVGPLGLALILRMDMDDATDIPVIPRLLYSLSKGNTKILRWFVQKRIVYFLAVPANGLSQGIESGVAPNRRQKIRRQAHSSLFGNSVNFPFYLVLDTWPKTREPLISYVDTLTVPVLFISGELDARTPPSQAQEIRKRYPSSAHLVVENAGHEQLLSHPEIKKRVMQFLNGKGLKDEQIHAGSILFIPLTGSDLPEAHPSLE
ncbi:alpha/beta hydrolase [Roseivirga sp. BDSF3-8]|uniref:alpha/beta hydrolase n=1 Tax=Roseivirga sp. BDSF3-8 TaxID=3241598 RepID=UPI0035319323